MIVEWIRYEIRDVSVIIGMDNQLYVLCCLCSVLQLCKSIPQVSIWTVSRSRCRCLKRAPLHFYLFASMTSGNSARDYLFWIFVFAGCELVCCWVLVATCLMWWNRVCSKLSWLDAGRYHWIDCLNSCTSKGNFFTGCLLSILILSHLKISLQCGRINLLSPQLFYAFPLIFNLQCRSLSLLSSKYMIVFASSTCHCLSISFVSAVWPLISMLSCLC